MFLIIRVSGPGPRLPLPVVHQQEPLAANGHVGLTRGPVGEAPGRTVQPSQGSVWIIRSSDPRICLKQRYKLSYQEATGGLIWNRGDVSLPCGVSIAQFISSIIIFWACKVFEAFVVHLEVFPSLAVRALDSLAQHLPAAELGVRAVGVLETVEAGGEVDLGARVLSRVLQF